MKIVYYVLLFLLGAVLYQVLVLSVRICFDERLINSISLQQLIWYCRVGG